MTLFTTNEIAKILRTTEPTVRRWIRDKQLSAYKSGNRHLVDSAHLLRYLTTNESEATYAPTNDTD